MAYGDDVTGKIMQQYMAAPFELLLGRRTYDIWAEYWPNHPEIELIATPFNATRKYVVSHAPKELSWNNSTLVTGDVVAELQELKTLEGPDLWVWGSGNLIQTLLKNHLIDRMHVWTHPLTLGSGRKLFADGTGPESFKLIDSNNSTDGVIFATYEPAGVLKK